MHDDVPSVYSKSLNSLTVLNDQQHGTKCRLNMPLGRPFWNNIMKKMKADYGLSQKSVFNEGVLQIVRGER